MKLTMKNRLFIALSLLIVIMMGATSFLVLRSFKQQIKENLATGQSLLVTEVAEALEDKLSLAQSQLISLSALVGPEIIASPEAAQKLLDGRLAQHKVFDNHLFLFTPEGRIFVESPFVPDRRGLDFSFRPYIQKTLASSAPYISDPYVSSQPHKHPVIMMTAPVFDQQGKLIAILAGSMDLMRPNLLGKLAEKKIGKSGYFYLTTMEGVMIMHPEKARVFTKMPVGKNLIYDRAIQGFEGTDENIDTSGVPHLTSFKQLQLPKWLLAASYPQAEAYAQLAHTKKLLLAGLLAITLAAFAIIRFFSQYLTQSLLDFTRHVTGLEEKTGEARLFHPTTEDETATLALAFNRMLKKLDRQQAEIQQSEELYRTLTEFASDFIFWRGPDQKLVFVSQNCAQFTGYSEEEFFADPGLLDALVDPEDREAWLSHTPPLDDTDKKLPLEFRIITKGGQMRWVDHTCTEIHDEEGRVLGLRGNLIDITERKQAEAEKAKLEGQLQQAQKMESVGRLAGGVAHDFNNMLGVIMGHTEMALMKVTPEHPLQSHLLEISKAAERSANLTRQLLAFSRKQTIAPRELDINETVSGMFKMLQRLIGEDIDLVWQPQEGIWPVLMDPSQLDQILANLCVNARDAILDVGKITIETANHVFDEDYCAHHPGFTVGDYVRIAISDSGCGMDKEMLTHIFEPFFTSKEFGKGTGLGLAMVYGAIRQNNGFINVYSEPGQGTTFSLYLPRLASKAELTTPTPRPAEPAPGGQETILLTEDEPVILEMTTTMLQMLGYTVLAANSPGEAIRLAQEHAGEIHLLMTDVVMPEMNGRDLATHLLSSSPQLKHLFMSGYTADVIAHHGVLDKGVCFIQKPFAMDTLAAKVRQALAAEQG
jgi:PAS domain S-box-containing protein